MHDDRLLVEERLDRALRERLRPAIHTLAVPFDVAVWRVPPDGPATAGHDVGEPVPVARALAPELPNRWDAWDIARSYRNTTTDLLDADSLEIVDSDGPVAQVRVVRTVRSSTISQVLTLRPGRRRLEIDTDVDWHEQETFLKLAFPLDVAAHTSTSEIQFGHLHRAAHMNTSWDAARFEICAHRWLHVGEAGYGVALVNDTTYGHDVTRPARPGGGTTTTVRW